MSKDIERQERQYDFPYHYIPSYENNNFSQLREFFGGYKYISYVTFLVKKLADIPCETIVEVGCGDGRVLCEVARAFPERKLLGIDISERALRYARAFAPSIEFRHVDVRYGQVGQYDVGLLIETLEHVDPEEIPVFLQGLARMVKGKLILTVPTDNVPLNSKHYQHFSLESLKRTLEPEFLIQEAFYLNRLGGMVVVRRLLTNRIFTIRLSPVWNWFYKTYTRRCLLAAPDNAERLLVVASRHESADGESVR